jgi:hypothetical protein
MDRWLAELKEIGLELFGRQSPGEMWALVAVCVFALFFLYGKMSEGFKGGGKRSFLTLIPGILLAGLAAVAVRLYWSPDWIHQLVGVGVVFLVVVLPLTAWIEKTSYQSSLLVWLVCGLVLAAILVLERPLVDSFRRGVKKGSLVREQKDFYEELQKK